MSKSWWIKFSVLIFTVVLASFYIYPTIKGLDPETSKYPVKQKVNMGLDLQGGVYMVLGVDFNRVYRDVVERQVSGLKDPLQEKNITVKSEIPLREKVPSDDPQVEVTYEGDSNALKTFLKDRYPSLRLVEDKTGSVRLGLSREYKVELKDKTLAQSIEVIRNRIDEFGVSEPSITSQGMDRVVVELPGVKDVERAKDLIGRTARLEFKMVNMSMSPAQVAGLVQKIEEENKIQYVEGKTKFSEYTKQINEKAGGKIPADSEIAFERVKEFANSETSQRIPYLLFKRADVTGDDLQDAGVSFDNETNRPNVSLSFNPKGTESFSKLTGDNVGGYLAIVLDNVIHSAPRLNERIPNGQARITLGSVNADKAMQEAKDLSTVLRAGALPAQLEFLEQRVVGPSLGQDSIKKGTYAAFMGAILVFFLVAIYYRVSGLIAIVTLVFNVIFVIACLVGLEATLTLPGIAGIALTVGIAVDSNVVIYERIREEIRAGKNYHAALESGFQKAFRTIVDANVTNALAAIVLMIYGTGPIKGFAVTMMIGIVTTLYTAVFASKVLMDWYLKRVESAPGRTLSI